MVILSTSPSQNQFNTQQDCVLTFNFDMPIDPESIHSGSIVVSTENLIRNKSLFNDENIKIISGDLSIDKDNNSILTFKPKDLLSNNTKYKVVLSKDIAGITPVTDVISPLGSIYSFSFTTIEEDKVQQLPQTYPVTTIIGNRINTTSDTVTPINVGSVTRTFPPNDAFNYAGTLIKIQFSDTVSDIESMISISTLGILEEEWCAVTLLDTDFTAVIDSVDDSIINITLVSVIPNNSFLTIRVDKNIKIAGSSLSNDYTFTYINKLDPYYCSVRLIRIMTDTIFDSITDIKLALLIAFYSSNADFLLAKIKNSMLDENYKYLLTNYIAASVIYSVVTKNSISNETTVKKQLGDFTINVIEKYGVTPYNQLLKDAKDVLDSIKDLIGSLGSNIVVKGINTASFPKDIGRLWDASGIAGLERYDDGDPLTRNKWVFNEQCIQLQW